MQFHVGLDLSRVSALIYCLCLGYDMMAWCQVYDMYDMYDSNMIGFMLYHARWMLGWYDMYARCMLGDVMLDVC